MAAAAAGRVMLASSTSISTSGSSIACSGVDKAIAPARLSSIGHRRTVRKSCKSDGTCLASSFVGGGWTTKSPAVDLAKIDGARTASGAAANTSFADVEGEATEVEQRDSSGEAAGGPVTALERSYLTKAANGVWLECNSKGCRPYVKPSGNRKTGRWLLGERLMEDIEHRLAEFRLKSERRDAMAEEQQSTGFAFEFAQFLDEVWSNKQAARVRYEEALRNDPKDVRMLVAYAKFAWKELKDVDRAEKLFKEALKLDPINSTCLASYALFLWECEGVK